MYIPDWAFEQQLRAYDRELSVRWIPHRQRWGIYRRTLAPGRLYRKDILVVIVQGPGGVYQALDQRTMDHLARIDGHRVGARAVADRLIQETIRQKETEQKDYARDVDSITRDVAAHAIREAGDDVGAANVPKEDLRADLVARYGEEVL